MKKLFLMALLVLSGQASAELIANLEHGATSVILRFPLYSAADPIDCPGTDLTHSTSGLKIEVSTDKTNGFYDQYQQSDSTLEAVTTIGTYSTPTATKARFKVVAAGSCWYELQLPDAAFAVSNAERLYIEVSDGGTAIIDSTYWVDLTSTTSASLIAALLDTSCSGYATTNDVGYQLCTALNAIDTVVDSTSTSVTTLATAESKNRLYTDVIDTVTSQTIFTVDTGPGFDDLHNGRLMCVQDTGGTGAVDCAVITDYVNSSGTWTIAEALAFTIEVGDPIWIPANDVNVESMNGSGVCGTGQPGTPWTGC